MTTELDFTEWRPVSWQWRAPCGITFLILVQVDIIDGRECETLCLYGNGCPQGRFSTMEKAKEKASEICNGVVNHD